MTGSPGILPDPSRNTCGICAAGSSHRFRNHSHCHNCRRFGHWSCRQCGACVQSPSGAHYRDDRVYCSPACRQKAYRSRKATGQ
jgi:hypothetical protein